MGAGRGWEYAGSGGGMAWRNRRGRGRRPQPASEPEAGPRKGPCSASPQPGSRGQWQAAAGLSTVASRRPRPHGPAEYPFDHFGDARCEAVVVKVLAGHVHALRAVREIRSEERRVGKEWRFRWCAEAEERKRDKEETE